VYEVSATLEGRTAEKVHDMGNVLVQVVKQRTAPNIMTIPDDLSCSVFKDTHGRGFGELGVADKVPEHLTGLFERSSDFWCPSMPR
jgi:hypothetical protein